MVCKEAGFKRPGSMDPTELQTPLLRTSVGKPPNELKRQMANTFAVRLLCHDCLAYTVYTLHDIGVAYLQQNGHLRNVVADRSHGCKTQKHGGSRSRAFEGDLRRSWPASIKGPHIEPLYGSFNKVRGLKIDPKYETLATRTPTKSSPHLQKQPCRAVP